MEWLTAQAQQASPFIASFCLLALGAVCRVAYVLWKQLLFERSEHRTAEDRFTAAANSVAAAMNRLAASVDRPRRRKR